MQLLLNTPSIPSCSHCPSGCWRARSRRSARSIGASSGYPASSGTIPGTDDAGQPAPVFSLVVLGLTLAGFVVLSVLGAEPFWAALVGVVVIGGKRLIRGDTRCRICFLLPNCSNLNTFAPQAAP